MTVEPQNETKACTAKPATVKCVVWDLDNTLWDGVLLEDPQVVIQPAVVEVIQALDRPGILNSIASKNDHELAMDKLGAFGIDEYFLYPQISWNSKSSSLEGIARVLNLGIDTLAFVDDQPFERTEVAYAQPSVLCLDVADLATMLTYPRCSLDLSPRTRRCAARCT